MTTVFGELDPTGEFILVTVVGGGDHERAQCAALLQAMTPAINPTANPEVIAVPLSWSAVTQLAHDFTGEPAWDGRPGLAWTPGEQLCKWLLAEIIRRSCDGDWVGEWPKREPMAHQRAGGIAVGMNGRFLFVDDMGTGKGGCYLMGLAGLEARNRNPWPALFVCPASVVDTILEEVPFWYPDWKAVAYRGTGRQKYLKSNARILVMGYETMRNDTGDSAKPGPLLKLNAGTLIGDECHMLCNYDSLQSRKFRLLAKHVRNVVPGSGTPITVNAAGFWPVLNSMYPGSYPSRDRYKKYYCIGRKAQYGNGDREVTGINPLRDKQFRAEMQGVFRRVALEDVWDMPPKSYQVRYVEIPAAWRAAYNQMEEDMLAELPDQMTPLEANVAVVKMMRLRQLACSACDVEVTREIEMNLRSPKYGTEVARTKVTLKEPCWKGAALVSLLDELHQAEGEHDELGRQYGHTVGSRPVLAFAESSQLVRVAGAMAEKKGYTVGYFDGDVKNKDRTAARLAFQDNKLDLLCVTTGAGGVGLNLTAAGDVAFLANPWGYVPRVQSERRAWRRGQDKPVMIYDFVTKDSVESRVAARLREKAVNLADLVQDRRIAEEFLGGNKH
ncbi:MAG TPA: DEAD/DEAH box helicase [Trebonia sp.]